MKSLILKTLASAMFPALAACAVQPGKHASLPGTVRAVAPQAWNVDALRDTVDTGVWWQQFGDPFMHQLIASVLKGNLDVQAALERVRQAQEIAVQRGAALLPELNATGTAASIRQNTPPPLGYVRQVGLGASASWTPDVFGGERLAVLAAQARVSDSRESLDELRLALAANTASAYIDLRWAQSEIRILEDNERIRSHALRLAQERLHYGLATQLDAARAQNQLSELQSRIPRVRSIIQHQLSLIAAYAGRAPETARSPELADARAIPNPAQSVPRESDFQCRAHHRRHQQERKQNARVAARFAANNVDGAQAGRRCAQRPGRKQ